ncbi:hypothetical protein [Nocardioides albertanoniae]|nr:hypothetical protein [Nocardioides albertanoniae]
MTTQTALPSTVLPGSVRLAGIAWSGAVAAGVLESAIAVTRMLADGVIGPGDWLGLGVHLVVYVVAALLIVGLLRGSRAARIALTLLLSVVGLASLVVPTVADVAGGASVAAALGGGGLLGGAFVVVRVAHILLVIVATAAMYAPTADAHFRKRA